MTIHLDQIVPGLDARAIRGGAAVHDPNPDAGEPVGEGKAEGQAPAVEVLPVSRVLLGGQEAGIRVTQRPDDPFGRATVEIRVGERVDKASADGAHHAFEQARGRHRRVHHRAMPALEPDAGDTADHEPESQPRQRAQFLRQPTLPLPQPCQRNLEF